jgi:imidazolonepropionase-like amidohydrolase
MEIDHRVGFIRPGYDADIVIWNFHPLSVGATPLQVFIDGKATLDPQQVESSQSRVVISQSGEASPSIRPNPSEMKELHCANIEKPGAKITIRGITMSYLEVPSAKGTDSKDLIMVVDGGKITCLDTQDQCLGASTNSTIIALNDAHVLPGLTAVTVALGLGEIAMEDSSGDGTTTPGFEDIVYAKYGIHLDGKSFARARIGGVTKAITAPKSQGFQGGISVALKTSGKKNVLNGGIVKDDVALHFKVGSASKSRLLHSLVTLAMKELTIYR